jgi:hypothetical protein
MIQNKLGFEGRKNEMELKKMEKEEVHNFRALQYVLYYS